MVFGKLLCFYSLFVSSSIVSCRVATVIFSERSQAQVIHNFDDVTDADGLIAAAPFLNARTDTARAYRFVFDKFINLNASGLAGVGRRINVPMSMVVVTDGFPTDAVC